MKMELALACKKTKIFKLAHNPTKLNIENNDPFLRFSLVF
jgi:hypothetical protein